MSIRRRESPREVVGVGFTVWDFLCQETKKRVDEDGHDREDVLKYRAEVFLPLMKRLDEYVCRLPVIHLLSNAPNVLRSQRFSPTLLG